MDDILIVENLVKHYPIRKGVVPKTVGYVKAVDGVSFTIPRGKTLGLVGESGCGKSVTGLSLLQLVPPPGRVAGGRILYYRDAGSEPLDLAALSPRSDAMRA